MQQLGKTAWVAMPDRQWADDSGKKRYAAIVELTEGLRRRVTETVLSKWSAT